MTRSEVGRPQRAASRLAYAPPIGGEALGPPTSQGAAERVTVRADRAVVRLGLRTLVVAGLAGAAWLLCANAAQAANAPATDRTSHLSAVDLIAAIGADDTGADPASEAASAVLSGTVTDVATTAHQPVRDAATSVVPPSVTAAHASAIAHPALPAGVIGSARADRPGGATAPVRDARTTASGRGASNDAGVEDLLGAADGLTAPLGLAGGAAGSALTRAVGPTTLNGLLRPVYGGLRPVAPVAETLRPILRSATDPAPPLGERRTSVAGGGGAPGGALPAAKAPVNDDRGHSAPGTGATRDRARSGSSTDAEPFPAGTPAGGSGTPDVPSRPSSAPMRGWVGTGSSTTGSGVPAEGGGYAVVPISAVDNAAAMRRPPVPVDVEVPRLVAEAPTVSPD